LPLVAFRGAAAIFVLALLSGCVGVSERDVDPMPVFVMMDEDGWLRFEFAVCAGDAQPSLNVSSHEIGGSSFVDYFARGSVVGSDLVVTGRIDPGTLHDGDVTSGLPRVGFEPYPSDIRGIDDIGRLSVSTDAYRASASLGELGLAPGESVVFTGDVGLSGSSIRSFDEAGGRAEIESWCGVRPPHRD